MSDKHASEFERRNLVESLKAQARLCERIASECWDEDTARQFRQMSKECADAAAEEAKPAVQAVWPVVLAF